MAAEWTLSVSQLNEYVRKSLGGDPMLQGIRVTGEISGFKRHFSGHLYFALKDESARVNCVMFRSAAASLGFVPEDGMRVIVTGSASLYVQTGAFQLYADSMARQGVGELYARFEALKRRLAAEGLFDPAIKRDIPLMPRVIGVVTSRTGAVLRDICNVARRRDPRVDILLSPCAVQGAGAAEEIARAIDRLNDQGEADVILCGRGGGSIEDLWAFNEEVVARAIRRSRIPVISCVGHETDFTIADFAADLRAPTPSAAAELAVPDVIALRQSLDQALRRSLRAMDAHMRLSRERLTRLSGPAGLGMPLRMLIGSRREALSALTGRLNEAAAAPVRRQRERLTRLTASLGTLPARLTERRALTLQGLTGRLERVGEQIAPPRRSRLEGLIRALGAVNPSAVLGRGYAVVKKQGGAVSSAGALSGGDRVDIVFSDGAVSAVVDQTDRRA